MNQSASPSLSIKSSMVIPKDDYESTSPFLDDGEKKPIYRSMLLITTGVFMGYSSMVILSHKLKDQLIMNKNAPLTDAENDAFNHGIALNYIGNLIFRLFHNIIFAFIVPRKRVYASLFFMLLSMVMLGFGFWVFKSTSIPLVYISYLLGGVSVGTYESNMLSCITPLGHDTKVWSILGMPVGFNMVSIIGFLLMGNAGMSAFWLYMTTAILCCLGIFLMHWKIPNIVIENNGQTFPEFIDNLKKIKQWFPLIWQHCFALAIDMFAVSFFTAYNIYFWHGGKDLPMDGINNSNLMNHDSFFSILNCCTFLGDFCSRKLIYSLPLFNPLMYCGLSLIGGGMCFAQIAWLVPIGMFFIFFANGAIYATTTKYIDKHVKKEFNLISLSFWLFIGDVGSVTGSNTWQPLSKVECKGIHNPYVCKN